MKFQPPFTFSNLEKLKKRSRMFIPLAMLMKSSTLEKILKNCAIPLTAPEYRAISIRSSFNALLLSFIPVFFVLFYFKLKNSLTIALIFSLAVSLFLFFSQTVYPKVYNNKRIRNIEKNLIPALEDMLIQLNSGVTLFHILANISESEYGELSVEFRKAVSKINAGLPEIEVLEDLGESNSSIYLKRTLWQLSNGMRAGSDVSTIVKESIKSLNEEQLLQIQNYGNKLNPLIMFYMLSTVILPAISIAFFTIISSMIGMKMITTMALFIGLFIFVMIFQITFLGLIKSARPSLL